MAPIAASLGVRVATVVALDEALELLPVPYAVVWRVPGWSLAEIGRDVPAAMPSWEAVGRQLARLHVVTEDAAPPGIPSTLRRFRQTPEVDPRPWLAEAGRAGWLAPETVSAWGRRLDRLSDRVLGAPPLRLCHGDVNAGNVIVDPADASLVTLIDWAGAGWLDPVWDLVGVPLAAVPVILRGYRAVAPFPGDHTALAEGRLVWCRAQVALDLARRDGLSGPGGADRLVVALDALDAYAREHGVDR
jgi:Ser/Thr protein kinase RdoA (MazF antagonist)